MAKVQERIIIELTKQEKKILDGLLGKLYDIEPNDDEKIGTIFGDIYNSFIPQENEKISRWKGVFADVIIKDENCI